MISPKHVDRYCKGIALLLGLAFVIWLLNSVPWIMGVIAICIIAYCFGYLAEISRFWP